jgi:ferredoxin
MAKSYCLQVDHEICNDCGICDRVLTGFRTNNQGRIYISESNYEKEHVREAVSNVIEFCPEDAISIVHNSSVQC